MQELTSTILTVSGKRDHVYLVHGWPTLQMLLITVDINRKRNIKKDKRKGTISVKELDVNELLMNTA